MPTFPDPTQPPQYPSSLSGLIQIQKDTLDPETIDPTKRAFSEDINIIYRNLVAHVEDVRDFIVALGLDPDASPDKDDLGVAGAFIAANLGGGGGGGGLDLNFEKLKTSGSPGFSTTISLFALLVLSGLEFGFGASLILDKNSVTSEDGFVVVDPDSVISVGPAFADLGTQRVVQFTTDAGALNGQTATIAWTWNSIPFKATVTVEAG